jgi:hypothetical protein
MIDDHSPLPFRRPCAVFILLLAGLLACLPAPAVAQVAPVEEAATPSDTLDLWQGPVRSPRGAFLRSLVLPGWGQAWVGSPGRGAAYFAMEAGSLWMVYRSRQMLGYAREEQQQLRDSGQIQPDARITLVRARESQVEDWTAVAVFLLFFSAADALVSAYLADFDEHVGVVRDGDGLRLEARIPVGRR